MGRERSFGIPRFSQPEVARASEETLHAFRTSTVPDAQLGKHTCFQECISWRVLCEARPPSIPRTVWRRSVCVTLYAAATPYRRIARVVLLMPQSQPQP